MNERKMICIECPVGCEIQVKLENGQVTEITGNACKRGESYARDECTAPKRTLTTTVRASVDGVDVIAPVKTSKPIPKELLREAMNVINNLHPQGRLPSGSIICKNILNTDVDVVLTDAI